MRDMKIAKMDKRITLQRPVTREDDYGGLETVYEDDGKVWARMERTDYAEQQAEGTPMNREQVRIRIRPRRDIKRGWRVLLEGDVFVVETADNTFRDNTMLILRHYEPGV